MNFDWIKRIFNKPVMTSKSVGVATIDTSFIYVPKFNELNKSDQEKVLNYYNNLSLDNYESLVKYSDGLSSNYMFDKEILRETIIRYDKNNRYIKENEKDPVTLLAKKIICAVLSKYEYEIIYNNFMNTRKELILRLIALNMFIKKESKRKYDFIGIFGKAERLKYLNDKNKLTSEQERLRIAIKDNMLMLSLIQDDIKENDNLKEKFELLGQYETMFDNEKSELSCDFEDELPRAILSLNSEEFYYTDLWEPFVKEVKERIISKLVANYNSNNSNDVFGGSVFKIRDLGEELIYAKLASWTILIESLSKDLLEELYRIIAKYLREYQIYYISHKDYYLNILEMMNKTIDEYKNKTGKLWNLYELEKIIKKYENTVYKYSELYKGTITKDKIEILYDSLHKLNWMFYLSSGRDIMCDMKDEEYIKYSDELLREVEEKYGVYLNNRDNSKRAERNRIEFIKNNMYFHFADLFELLLDDSEFMNSRYPSYDDYYHNKLYDLKFIDKRKPHPITIPDNFTNFCSKIKAKRIRKTDDDRLLIFPKNSEGYPVTGSITYKSNIYGFFASNSRDIKSIFNITKSSLNTMYLFIPVDSYGDIYKSGCKYRFGFGDITFEGTDDNRNNTFSYRNENGVDFKIIFVPSSTKYEELSELLDYEIRKEKNKVLGMAC